MRDLPLDRLGRDGFVAERMVYYAALYPRLRETSRQHGYALALHGSLTKDLDVIAVPWVEDAADESTLATALAETAGGEIVAQPVLHRPHGRHSVVIHLGRAGGYVDLSIMERHEGNRDDERRQETG
jgi:hypothetical protein